MFLKIQYIYHIFPILKLITKSPISPLNQHNLSKQEEVMGTSHVLDTCISDDLSSSAIPTLGDITFTFITGPDKKLTL